MVRAGLAVVNQGSNLGENIKDPGGRSRTVVEEAKESVTGAAY
jgi:hypothetical protein